jgi:hypothetical protein
MGQATVQIIRYRTIRRSTKSIWGEPPFKEFDMKQSTMQKIDWG